MKNNRFVGALAAVTVIVALCAGLVFKVSLAKPVEAGATGDKLIGVFVFKELADSVESSSRCRTSMHCSDAKRTCVSSRFVDASYSDNNRLP